MPFCPFKLTLGDRRVEVVPSIVGPKNGAIHGVVEDPRECERGKCQWWIPEVVMTAQGAKPTGAGNCVANWLYRAAAEASAAQGTLVQLKMKENNWTVNQSGEVIAAPEA